MVPQRLRADVRLRHIGVDPRVDANRPRGLASASAEDRPPGISESFGTLRYGRLAGTNPFGAVGLEWTTQSPPPTANFEVTPTVTWEAYDYPSTVDSRQAAAE